MTTLPHWAVSLAVELVQSCQCVSGPGAGHFPVLLVASKLRRRPLPRAGTTSLCDRDGDKSPTVFYNQQTNQVALGETHLDLSPPGLPRYLPDPSAGNPGNPAAGFPVSPGRLKRETGNGKQGPVGLARAANREIGD